MTVDSVPQPEAPQSIQLNGGRHGVLLFHGLSSSPLELQFLARGLHRAGYTVRVPAIEGYTYAPGQKGTASVRHWIESALHEFDTLRNSCDHVSLGGLCLGSVLALRAAALRPGKVHSMMCLSTALHYDSWGNPWFTPLLPLARLAPFVHGMRVRERDPYGLKDVRMRAWVAKQMKQAGESDAGAASLQIGDILKARRLIASVRRNLGLIHCPILLVHAKEDENATPRSAFEVAMKVRGDGVRVVLLQNSYHMISIDQEKETVLHEMKLFLGQPGQEPVRRPLPEPVRKTTKVLSLFENRNGTRS